MYNADIMYFGKQKHFNIKQLKYKILQKLNGLLCKKTYINRVLATEKNKRCKNHKNNQNENNNY